MRSRRNRYHLLLFSLNEIIRSTPFLCSSLSLQFKSARYSDKLRHTAPVLLPTEVKGNAEVIVPLSLEESKNQSNKGTASSVIALFCA
ncbi:MULTISPECIES: hypothetical protein [unclassified Paenibacillus]|uniref:hypothetical protein n=1 Tax=unclassified Paenibacillus TaxID=185978 RepID=UPI00362D9EB7